MSAAISANSSESGNEMEWKGSGIFVNHNGAKMVDVWNVNKLTEARTKMEVGKSRTKRYSHARTCALLKKFIEIQGWVFLTFFICFHNQLSTFNSIIV